jgi:hypothetical protein
MNHEGRRDGNRWLISGLVAVAAGGLTLMLFRAPEASGGPVPRKAVAPLFVRADHGVDPVFDEQKSLTDPMPLFLPSKWNATPGPFKRPDLGSVFENFAPEFVGPAVEDSLKGNFPSPVRLPASPMEALADSPTPLFAGISRSSAPTPAVSERGAFVRVIADGTGQTVWSKALQNVKPPGDGTWQPLEFFAHVNTLGLAGTPALTRRSGVEGVDEYFQRYLVQTLRIGQQLVPGFYRIVIGP